METYQRSTNPPLTCNPCGHVMCKPCLETWFRTSNRSGKKCPECRGRVSGTIENRALMDLVEANNTNTTNTSIAINTTNNTQTNHLLPKEHPIFNICRKSKKTGELIYDKCQYAIYIIDNSGSMDNICDGKTFSLLANNDVKVERDIIRWKEAVSKTLQRAEYNIKRGMVAAYYLLNPYKTMRWEEDIDYMVIDPSNVSSTYDILDNLKDQLLTRENIRGTTPLDKITAYFQTGLNRLVENVKAPICFNFITDGEPDQRHVFELQLQQLCKKFNIFLVINLCTDDDEIVKYYNDLDVKLGGELSGMEVLDDYQSEANEVWNSGNCFFTYSLPLHIARMAGAYSVISDWMDEIEFQPHYANKLIVELTKTRNLPSGGLTNEYLEQIQVINNQHQWVYDIRQKKLSPLININRLKLLHWKHSLRQYLHLPNYPYLLEGGVVVLFLIILRIINA